MIISKSKNKLIYILSFIFSIYISYLVCRLYRLNIIGNCFIVILIITLFEYLTYLWHKNIDLNYIINKVKKKNKIISIFLILIISTFFLFCEYKFFSFKYDSTALIVHSNEVINGDIIKKMSVNDVFYNVKNNKLVDAETFNINLGIEIKQLDDNNIRVDIPKLVNVKIYFNETEKNLIIKDGNISSKINSEDYIYGYDVKSNSCIDRLFILRLILSLITIIYIITLLTTALLCLKKDKKYKLILFIGIIFIGWIYFKMCAKAVLFDDSGGYIWSNWLEIFRGELKGRTPFYPLIIKISQDIFQYDYLRFVCIFQYIIWFFSILYLYKLLELIIKNKNLIIFFTFIYALCPGIIDWNNIILTESIAISVTVIIVYFIVKYLNDPKVITGSIAIILSFILTFHRPTSIIYVILLELFWIMRFIFDKKNIKSDFICFLISTLTIILIVIYAIVFQKKYSIYSISDAVPRQHLYVCIKEGFYKNSDDEKYIEEITQAKNNNPNLLWTSMVEVLNKHTLQETQTFTKKCFANNKYQYIKYLIKLNLNNLGIKFSYYSFKMVNKYIIRVIYIYNICPCLFSNSYGIRFFDIFLDKK